MRTGTVIKLSIITFFLFITVGQVMPQPIGTASQNTIHGINQFLIGLFPEKEFKNPNDRTQKAVDELNQ